MPAGSLCTPRMCTRLHGKFREWFIPPVFVLLFYESRTLLALRYPYLTAAGRGDQVKQKQAMRSAAHGSSSGGYHVSGGVNRRRRSPSAARTASTTTALAGLSASK